MNTTLLLPLPTSSKSGPMSPVPLGDVPEVRLELRLVNRQAKKSQTRPQPLARALQQVVARHRAVWSTPATAPAAVPAVATPAAPAATSVPSPFHLVVPALEASAKSDARRPVLPTLRVGSMRRETN